MTDDEKRLVRQLDSDLGKAWFRRTGRKAWHRTTDDCTLAVALTKSPYGMQYYVDLGAVIRPLEDIRTPKVKDLHISIRLSQLVAGDGAYTTIDARGTDLEDSTTPLPRKLRELSDAIVQHGLPFLDAIATVDRMRATVQEGRFPAAAVWGTARTFLQNKNP